MIGHDVMEKADRLIRTKLRLPFTRAGLVPRPRLQARIAEGLCGPLTLVTAPAGFGKTTVVASSVAAYGMRVAWLSLDKDDNQPGRFLRYLVAALQQAVPKIGSEAAQLLAAARQASPEVVLTSVINDLDSAGEDVALVLDDYQFISSQAVHGQVAFLLEHCPATFHVVIATRSDPPLPLVRLRARGQTVELRAADLSFSVLEAAQFLNDTMGLGLDDGSVAVLEERTEGWIAGLQMAALSMRDHRNVPGFIAGFSGTNRYILDYLVEEVLASQPPEVQQFLLHTSILERLAAPLCDAVLANAEGCASQSASTLEYLERANLFLVPLDDERIWYRYHHLFADLLRAQLQKSLGAQGVAELHVRAAEWHGQNGSVLEAISHASLAADDERVERFVEQNYREMVSRGEMSEMRSWTSKLSREMISRRPWLCIYAAYGHSWFGELDEADRLLAAAEKRLRSEIPPPDADSMLRQLAYVQSRVTAMRGDLDRAIKFCLQARETIPASNLSLQFDSRVTLGYEYFLKGDFANAGPILEETIRSGIAAGAVINTVAAACLLARLVAVQGELQQSYSLYQMGAQLIQDAGGEHRDATALVEIGFADVLCELNDVGAALAHAEQGLALMPWWGKADDSVLAYLTLARIHLALGSPGRAGEAVEKAKEIVESTGLFPEARTAAEVAQVKLWLAQGDVQAAGRWATAQQERLSLGEAFRFENELHHITWARVLIAQERLREAAVLLSHLEATAQSAGRLGRAVEILLLQALTLRQRGDSERALAALTDCLTLAEPRGYVRLFLDEGRSVQMLLAHWLAHAGAGPVRGYALRLLSHWGGASQRAAPARDKASPAGGPVEPLSQRELEVLHLMAQGSTNQEIARQLVVAPGTVKAHTASIYRKLDVANRTEAVARARELGFLA
jgi:LuxR family maltose regulon positive regulatory protein